MIGESFHAIRKWSADNVAPKPDCKWAEISVSGFCALHALVEEESRAQGRFGNTWWTQRTIVAVECGANPRWVEPEMNNTPLHWCSWHAAPGCARALLDTGADWRARNRANESAEALCRRLLCSENSSGSRMQRMSLLLDILIAARESDELFVTCGQGPSSQKHNASDGVRL